MTPTYIALATPLAREAGKQGLMAEPFGLCNMPGFLLVSKERAWRLGRQLVILAAAHNLNYCHFKGSCREMYV